MNRFSKKLCISLAIAALFPTLGFNWGDYQEHPGMTLAFLAVILLFCCTLPMMTIKGAGTYGAAAWLQIPGVVMFCLIVFLALKRRRVGLDWRVLIAVATYVVGTLVTNLMSPMFRLDRNTSAVPACESRGALTP